MLATKHSDLLRQGIAAAKRGQKETARGLLLEATEVRPDSELAWLWLASVAGSRADTISYLERALELNPADERAQSWLTNVRARAARRWTCPLCGGESLVEVQRCPACRAVLSLEDLDALLEGDVDTGVVGEAVARLEAATGEEVSFEVHYNLGLAYLNLGRMYEGITRLRVASQMRPDQDDLRTRVAELVERQRRSARAAAEMERLAAQASAKKTVLAVDDSATVLKIVGMALERQGHEVLVASNAMQALAKLDEIQPDLILLDISMPHMDGYQLCKLIKSNRSTSEIPVVMLSGKDGFFDKVRGRLVGSCDYITKPFDPATLVEAVEKHCKREA